MSINQILPIKEQNGTYRSRSLYMFLTSVNNALKSNKSYDQKLGNLSTIIKDLYVSVLKLSKSLSADPFVGLKEISEAFKLNGKSLYTQKTLRNKIKIEKFGNVIIGYLDILNLHIVMMKKGKYWITPLVHWENERRKIDYYYLTKLRHKNKNVYDKKFPKRKSFSSKKKENEIESPIIKKEAYNVV